MHVRACGRLCVCVRACVRACVRVCARVCAWIERDRQTEPKRERETETQRQTETERQRDSDSERERQKQRVEGAVDVDHSRQPKESVVAGGTTTFTLIVESLKSVLLGEYDVHINFGQHKESF